MSFTLRSALPQVLVNNVMETMKWFIDRLGFRACVLSGDPPGGFGIVDLGDGDAFHLACDETARIGRRNRPVQVDAVDVIIESPTFAKEAQVLEGPEGLWLELRHGERTRVMPVLLVSDVVRAARWYQHALGFEERSPGELFAGHCALKFVSVLPETTLRRNADAEATWDFYIESEGMPEIIQRLNERQVHLQRGPLITEYQMYELEFVDGAGYTVAMGEPIQGW